MTWHPVPLTATTDLNVGGRWTSLRSVSSEGQREWLWRNPHVPEDARRAATPGSAFIDAGGGEECLPSVVGRPEDGLDHGDLWYRTWQGTATSARVVTPTHRLALHRRLTGSGGLVRADYTISGAPDAGLVHALHLLLNLSTAAVVIVPGRPPAVIRDRPVAGGAVRTFWPDGDGVDLSRLGPDDGTARCAVVASDAVDIVDGDEQLSLRWGATAGVPVSFVLWRNLGGWPADRPYRSIGVEPMIGSTTDAATAAPGEPAVVSESGRLQWWLEIRALRKRRS